MTNKEKYKASFSGVEPSDEILERVFDMTSTKKKVSFKKVIAIAAAIVMILAMAMVTANAASDGELLWEFMVLINGEEADSSDYTLEEDENGALIFEYSGSEDSAADIDEKIQIIIDETYSGDSDVSYQISE